ncbi:MAG: DUF4238 domain-containing protein [Methylococcales bacterium]
MPKTRDNHFVPQWYQSGFISDQSKKIHYLDLNPDTKKLSNGRVITMNYKWQRPTSQCFYQTDLYTTFFGDYINDEIERFLFGKIDDTGAKAVRAYIDTNMQGWHTHFRDFFAYIDSQKIRTPKGLDWIKSHYPNLSQLDLMIEMQEIRNIHCTLWTEGVREIVSAHNSKVKFITTDHPVTVYNYACDPSSEQCLYPNDPSITLKGTQTLYPLDENHCLILTNLEYAQDHDKHDPLEKRTNSRLVRQSIAKTDALIRSRNLNDVEVSTINLILKKRAKRYIAASKEEWLYPEKNISSPWSDLKSVLLPPSNELYHFGGEMIVGYKDGSSYYQDEFGRTKPENKYLKKDINKSVIKRNDICGCGSGKKYKKCCIDIPENERPTWDVLSIRERNLILYRGIDDILGFNKGKDWDEVRRELNNDKIIKIHDLYDFLWPIETDIFNLLPKSDETLRAVYTGMLDPRLITQFALGSAPYFDEIIIQHPFVHPRSVQPDFDPIKFPHQYKSQTIKNIILFMYLRPFVDAGVINFIPDPCVFDNYLHHQMINMANSRRNTQKINKKEEERYLALHKEDFERTMRELPKEQQIHMIRKAIPDISQKKVDILLKHMEEQRVQDPLALLQEDAYSEGGQLMISSMTPNFEMVLLIAQVTRSVILTDSETRWEELIKAQNKVGGFPTYPWVDLCNLIASKEFYYSAIPETNFENRMNSNFEGLRKSLRDIYSLVKQNKFILSDDLTEKLKLNFIKGHEETIKYFDKSDPYNFTGKMSFLIPKGGFVNNNVQRLLLKSGSENHLSYAPVVVYIEPT